MEETVMEVNHSPETNVSEFDSLLHPHFDVNFYNSSSDQALLENSISDLRFLIEDDGDFELTFDSVDDIYIPSENESLGISSEISLCNNREYRVDSDCSGTSNESENHISEATNTSSFSHASEKLMVAHKFKAEEEESTMQNKRKKENEEDTSDEFRNNKYRRSNEVCVASGGEEDGEKRSVARLIRNRESAQLSRQRKKHYVEELEEKAKNLSTTITVLNSKISYFMAEYATLRQHVCPGSGIYRPPLVPMVYPWMQYPVYMVKPQGSQVSLLPIPRWKPQELVAKVKKSERKRSEAKKTKKVASVSVLGLLFCLLLFGALAPIVNLKYGGVSIAFYGEYDKLRGRVFHANSHLDVFVNSNRPHCGRDSDQGVGRNVSAPPANGSEPLVASLFVPRNEKLVKIDGNLIIHSSEKAMAYETNKDEGKCCLTTTKGFSPALPLPDYRKTGDMSKHLHSEKQEALSSSGSDDTSKDQLKLTTANDKMQQWFREDVAGPMFSSGMCTEVFQFDVSTTSGTIIPATEQPRNTTGTDKRNNNRRILRGGPSLSDFNPTKGQNSSSKENYRDTKPDPSMVVSVLVDPREGGDGDIDGMMGGTESLTRVYIVVLVDGVKYVTYSCVLPRLEVPPLVTT